MEGEGAGGSNQRAFDHLETFAERSRRADEQTELVAVMPSLLQRSVIYVVLAALVITLLILYFGKIQVVVETKGKILPEGDILTLQAGESGVVVEVVARLGDYLPAGAVVAKIDSSEADLSLAQVQHEKAVDAEELRVLRATLGRIASVLADPQRLVREGQPGRMPVSAGTYLLLNNLENAQIRLEAAVQEERLLPDRRRQLQREQELTVARVRMLGRTREDSAKALAAEEEALVRKRAELDNVRKLADGRLLSVVELNAAEERYRAAELSLLNTRQRLDQFEVDISTAELRLTELQTNLQTLENEAAVNARNARSQYEQALANLRQERETLDVQARGLETQIEHADRRVSIGERRLEMASVVMPVAGTIAELKVRNPGEIVSAGAPIATVVPSGVPLFVEASATNKDVGFVRPGLEARIKVDAFPFQQFGAARARVTKVLPAVGSTSSFIVQLELLDQKLSASGGEFNLFPGLSVQADLITGQQRLIQVLLQGGDEEGGAGDQ